MNGRVVDTPAWPGTYGDEAKPRMGFFTDTSICIGCKACEVACKEWNLIPPNGTTLTGMSYDNTVGLGAGRLHVVLQAVVAQGALPDPAVALALIEHAEGASGDAVAAAVADVRLDEHSTELGPHD